MAALLAVKELLARGDFLAALVASKGYQMPGLVAVFRAEQRLEGIVAAFRADAGYGVEFFGAVKIHDVTHVGGIPITAAPAAGSKGGGIDQKPGGNADRISSLLPGSRPDPRLNRD